MLGMDIIIPENKIGIVIEIISDETIIDIKNKTNNNIRKKKTIKYKYKINFQDIGIIENVDRNLFTTYRLKDNEVLKDILIYRKNNLDDIEHLKELFNKYVGRYTIIWENK